MKTTVLKATPRTALGTRYARREREAGQVPAVLYGHKQTPEAVALLAHDVVVALGRGARVLSLDVNGTQGQYLIKEVQYDYRGSTPIHLDLMRVDLDERVKVSVRVELRGTPKGAADEGVLDQLLSEVEVECLVTEIPESFRALVTHLGVGDSLCVADLTVPPGVIVLNELDETIATVRLLAMEAEAAPAAEGEQAAQPEVIGRGKEQQEEAAE